jgi:tRNA pseudouridine synthase 10
MECLGDLVLVSRDKSRRQEPSKQLTKVYILCEYCSVRQGMFHSESPELRVHDEDCYICQGLMNQLDSIVGNIITAIDRRYEFGTFLIGASLPTEIYEREDELRAKFKIHGEESIKNQLTRILRLKFAKLTTAELDYLLPDLVVNLLIQNKNEIKININSRALLLAGRYTKKCRGIVQKQTKCHECRGKGCNSCDNSGLSGYDSIEGIIAKYLMAITKGESPRFTWVGSEDRQSLVLGKGRPFFVSISNPKKRKFKEIVKVDNPCISASVTDKFTQVTIGPPLKFVTKTRILVSSSQSPSPKEYNNLKTLNGVNVSFHSKSRVVIKKIYSAYMDECASNEFYLTIVADGGLAIKQFVEGREYMKPTVSELLSTNCECILFDVLDVWLR